MSSADTSLPALTTPEACVRANVERQQQQVGVM